MADTFPEKNWTELYKDALLETDHTHVCARIEQAEKAIKQRALQLWYSQSPQPRERQDLDVALHFLALLKSFASEANAPLAVNSFLRAPD
jgi:hypothetical protein